MPESITPTSIVEPLAYELDAISERLVTARLNAEALSGFPGELPDTLEEAYAIQRASIARWPDEVVGWKVGMVAESFRGKLAAKRLAGPVFKKNTLRIDAGTSTTVPIFSDGFAAIEAEFVFELGSTVEPLAGDLSDEYLIGLVSQLFIGAEIASSPLAVVNDLGPCSIASDFGNNAGLLVGPSVPNWSSLPADELAAVVTIDDTVVGEANADAIEGGLLQALRFLLEVSAARGIRLRAGTLISSGAVTGIHEVRIDSNSQVDFGVWGSFNVAFESMRPTQ